MRKGSFMTEGLIISIIFILNFSVRAVPMLINYQGKLIDVDGKLLDDDYIINFYLYKEEDNGTAIWSEEQTVTVTKGIFNTQLGAGKGDPLSLDLFDNDKLYLEIRIHNPDAESIETLLPRQRLTSTAYAIKAGDAKKSFVNVRDFGAIGDGNTPDNEAIQSAVDHAHNAGIGAVFLPRGIYLLRRAIKLKDPINLFGGGDTSILKCGVLADDPHDIHYNCVIYITGNNIQLNSFAINGNRVNIEGLSP